MRRIQKHCADPWLVFLQIGIKEVEIRRAKGIWPTIKPGEVITLFNENTSTVFRVLHVNSYKSFEECLTKETLERCLPGVLEMKEGLEIYANLNKEDPTGEKTGVVAIRLDGISNLLSGLP